MKKVSLRKSDITEQTSMPEIPEQEEESENKEVNGNNVGDTNEKSNSLKKELPLIHSMNSDELNDHIQKCLEMNTENKITAKNAFGLQLIDYMAVAMEKKDFSTMACTLDAGAKIYSYRVDALHRQVMQLAGEIGQHQKEKKRDDKERHDKCLSKENRKAKKKHILSSSENLRRKLKGKHPMDKYIKLDGRPGVIMSSWRLDDTNLSLSLENNLPFWKNWEDYKPTEAEGTVTLPEYKIIRDQPNEPQNLKSTQIKLTDLTVIHRKHHVDDREIYEQSQQSLILDDTTSDCDYEDNLKEAVNAPDKTEERGEDVNVIATAMKRLNENEEGGSTPFSRFEAMKLIFNKFSDYDYLNTKNAHLWAGPEFWKRPRGALQKIKENRLSKKNKTPKAIIYEDDETGEIMKKYVNKKGSILSKRTITGWKRNKLTLPEDFKYEAEYFLDLFQMSMTSGLTDNTKQSVSLKEGSDSVHVVESAGLSSSQDTLNNSFYDDPINSGSSEDKDYLNSAFYDVGLLTRPSTSHGFNNGIGTTTRVIKVEVDNNNTPPIEEACPVPVPKIVTTEPIKYSSRPICVDMQHLKQTMLAVIREKVEENAGEKMVWADDTPPEASFTDVLKNLPSRLESRTREDLSPAMSFMALLTLANENNLRLQSQDNDVVVRLE